MAQNCLYIGTVLPFRRKSISVILGTVKTLHSSRSGLEWLFSISVKVVVSILFQKARRVLNNERGEANYFSTVVFIFIAVLLLAFIIDLFSIISTKQELDHAADQMVKQIQLSGGVNSETDELFEFLSSQIEGAENISYSIDATYTSPRPSGMTNLLTRPSENPALNINQDFLLERVLRKHPDVIGVGEMRSAAESLSAAESSRTGHTVCTTIHSNSCNSTYRRMMTLAKRKYNMDDSILMQIMVEAYPIIVFTKQLEDRSRKIMEIIEGEDYQDGRLIAHSLYKYEVEDNVTDDRGETRVVGHHKKIGLISDSLKKRLLDNGISNKELEEFMQPPKEVG